SNTCRTCDRNRSRSANPERLSFDPAPHELRECRSLIEVARHDHGKIVATNPRYDSRARGALLQEASDFCKDLITGRMAIFVVDLLETIQLYRHDVERAVAVMRCSIHRNIGFKAGPVR